MNAKEVAKKIGSRSDYLTIAQFIAKRTTSAFLESVNASTFPIAEKIRGVGRDLGLLLYCYKIKRLFDITPDLSIDFPAQQKRFSKLLEKIKSQIRFPGYAGVISLEELQRGWYWGFKDQKKIGTPDTWTHEGGTTKSAKWIGTIPKSQIQLMLVSGLTAEHAYILANSGINSLKDLANADVKYIASKLSKISAERAPIWIEMASKLVEAGILTHESAADLPLAQKINGITPEIAATLFVLGIKTVEDFTARMNYKIRDIYFPWITNQQLTNWFEEAIPSYIQTQISLKEDKDEDWRNWEGPEDWKDGWAENDFFGQRVTLAERWCIEKFPLLVPAWEGCSALALSGAFLDTLHIPDDGKNIQGKSQKEWIQDAFRHTFWNCCMVRAFKIAGGLLPDEEHPFVSEYTAEDLAKLWADAHEAFPGNPENEKAMDLHNNQVGRNLAVRPTMYLDEGYWDLTPCEILVTEVFKKGEVMFSLPFLILEGNIDHMIDHIKDEYLLPDPITGKPEKKPEKKKKKKIKIRPYRPPLKGGKKMR